MTAASDSERANTLSNAIVQLVGAMTSAICNDPAVTARIRDLMKAVGGRCEAPEVTTPATVALLDDLTAMLIETALPGLIDESTDTHLADIRQFFLDPKKDYGLTDLAALWRVTFDDVQDFLGHEIQQWENNTDQPESPFRMSWAEAVGMSTRFNLLRAFDVEVALAEDFDRVRSERWRTVPLLIRLPRFIVESIADPEIGFRGHRALAVRIEDFFLELYQEQCNANLLQLAGDAEEDERDESTAP